MNVFSKKMLFQVTIALIFPATLSLSAPPPPGQKDDKKDKDAKIAPLIARCDRADAIYPVGAKAKFVISSTTTGAPVKPVTFSSSPARPVNFRPSESAT